MDIDAIKKIGLVDFLNHMGYQSTGRDSRGLWFLSPYRGERKPSFHVNPNKGLWFDFGTGEGGDTFSLAGKMINSDDFMKQAEFIAKTMQMPVKEASKPPIFNEEPTFENISVSKLTSPKLLGYLANRGIPRNIAQRYCVQVDYDLHGKHYYAIGFQNQALGYELRNPFAKLCIPPKAITHIANGNSRCNVYEGFIDFLSAERLSYNDGNDVVVFNSVSNVQKAMSSLADYSVINCYLDNDDAGRMALARLQKEYGDSVTDKSALYPDHKDLNDFLVATQSKITNKLKL